MQKRTNENNILSAHNHSSTTYWNGYEDNVPLDTSSYSDKLTQLIEEYSSHGQDLVGIFAGPPSRDNRALLQVLIDFMSDSYANTLNNNKDLSPEQFMEDLYTDYLYNSVRNNDYLVIFDDLEITIPGNFSSGDVLDQSVANFHSDVEPLVHRQTEERKKTLKIIELFEHFIHDGYLVVGDNGRFALTDLIINTKPSSTEESYISEFSRSDIVSLIINHKLRNAEGIIDKSGNFWASKSTHNDMLQLLIAMGVDLRGALRVNENPLGGMSVSSLSSFMYLDERLTHDNAIYMTKPQAKTLYDFLDELYRLKGNSEYSVAKVLEGSEGLGYRLTGLTIDWDNPDKFDNQAVEHNLELLLDLIYKKYDPDKGIHNDHRLYELEERLIDSNNIRRSKIFNNRGTSDIYIPLGEM